MQSCPLLPGPISHFLLWDASLGPINRLRASSVWQRADVKDEEVVGYVPNEKESEAESKQLCFLFVGIRLTDLYLVSEGPLASANPHHLQAGALLPSKSLKNSPFCGLITLHFGPIKQTLSLRHKPHTTWGWLQPQPRGREIVFLFVPFHNLLEPAVRCCCVGFGEIAIICRLNSSVTETACQCHSRKEEKMPRCSARSRKEVFRSGQGHGPLSPLVSHFFHTLSTRSDPSLYILIT